MQKCTLFDRNFVWLVCDVFYESFGFGGGMSVGGSFNFVVCVFQLLKTFYRVLIF